MTTPCHARLVLDLPRSPVLTAVATTLDDGLVRYAVRGDRVHGALVVVPSADGRGHEAGGGRVSVRFGDGPGRVRNRIPRPEEPVVNGVRIHGATEVVDPDRLHRHAHLLTANAFVLAGDATRRIPDGARTTVEAVLKAVIAHWAARPDRDELVSAAERHSAPQQVKDERRKIADLEQRLTALRAERAEARRAGRRLGGIVRRRPLTTRGVEGVPALLHLADSDGAPLGKLAVAEREVNILPGHVVYEISGTRIRSGLVTIGPNVYGYRPEPRGFYVCWGRLARPEDRNVVPVINRRTLTGGWNYDGDGRDLRTVVTSVRESTPTAVRAAAVLRAIGSHFLARPDIEALNLAASRHAAPGVRAALTARLARLRAQESSLVRQLGLHRRRERHFTALLPPVPPEESRHHA
ncbi:hypothetical protein ACIOG4_28015 [Streptomyces microflavus]|uniref:hypothetical protein n=1 Tax=Streptomyces microflavus TaxID=1919 RepID=UPI00382506E5